MTRLRLIIISPTRLLRDHHYHDCAYSDIIDFGTLASSKCGQLRRRRRHPKYSKQRNFGVRSVYQLWCS